MTTKLNLRSFLFLFTVSCWVSGSYSLGVVEKNLENTTVSNYTQQYNNETMLQPTNGPPQTTGIREELSVTARTPSQNTTEVAHSQPAQGNGTSENLYNIEGTETNSTKHQPAGNESMAGTESPAQTAFPEKNRSLDLTTPSSAPTFSASVGANGTNATNSAPILRTTHHMVIDATTSRTSFKPAVSTTRDIKTTPTHTSTKPYSTQKTDKSTTKLCPTAEPKREGLVGRCLIAIASLAALATIFIMTTIILATKLAGNRYRHRGSLLNDTEMVCISTLMNDSDHPMPTPRHPKSNGALIPITEDEDGDDLTLNSFLHDTEALA
ncbi:P-selectin glycoprotein ligand 1 [Hemibagrus wyckioides]|uniref:P-selectin glycoprotein ligand 1 n=1 Tax=Hemibagrus wyckioides TaxID=337641 RepID=UPI00266BA653|nr:P-selectin glycoprotein ligand 1 [Hemibagrus wyckioides]XP_058230724.1 P-selectin glycoprotein ligand 1 [Hemibagrus wyckioides]